MIVSILFDTEYYGMMGRDKWFLKNLTYARECDCLIITHKCIVENHKNIIDNCPQRFYDEFEMRHFSEEEYKEISVRYIDDELFESLETSFASRTDFLTYLFAEVNEVLLNKIRGIIDEELIIRNQTNVDIIFNCLDSFCTIDRLGEIYKCPIICYSFSAIRKMHGYRETLYMGCINTGIKDSVEARKRYEEFKKNKSLLPVFTNKEIIALFGKEKHIPLLPLADVDGIHELGICKTPNSLYPSDFHLFKYTDTDLYYEAQKKLKTSDIIIRDHPNIAWNGTDRGYRRSFQRNDPVSFILSCKRITSVDSQILLKGLLWNRKVYAKGNLMSFEYICNTDFNKDEHPDSEKISHYIFSFLIPNRFMFDIDYWNWRLREKPNEHDIYEKHLNYYINKFGLDKNIIYETKGIDRLNYLIENRKQLINLAANSNYKGSELDYDALYSSIVLKLYNGEEKEIYCINHVNRGKIHSNFRFSISSDKIKEINFRPLIDVGGLIKIISINLDHADNLDMFFDKGTDMIPINVKNSGDNAGVYIIWSLKKW